MLLGHDAIDFELMLFVQLNKISHFEIILVHVMSIALPRDICSIIVPTAYKPYGLIRSYIKIGNVG